MLTHCIFCRRELKGNRVLEHVPAAQRVAFDPQRGRLWSICEHCQGWTLQPFDQRWEALEELERITRDRARLLVQGENIALLRDGELELLRIGRATLPEEAWWRYGDELARRHQRAGRIARRGKIIDNVIASLIVGVPVWFRTDPTPWIERARYKAFGKVAWQGIARCQKCGRGLHALKFRESLGVQVSGTPDDVQLRLPCDCAVDGVATLAGPAAAHTLRRLLAWHNFKGASQADVLRATSQVEESGAALVERLFPEREPLGALNTMQALALEIALNNDIERALLQMELAELQARWREEEGIAAIADRELT